MRYQTDGKLNAVSVLQGSQKNLIISSPCEEGSVGKISNGLLNNYSEFIWPEAIRSKQWSNRNRRDHSLRVRACQRKVVTYLLALEQRISASSYPRAIVRYLSCGNSRQHASADWKAHLSRNRPRACTHDSPGCMTPEKDSGNPGTGSKGNLAQIRPFDEI